MDELLLRLSAFVVQALELDDDPRDLAAEIVALKRDLNAGISSVELDSSVGPAAFLIYHYLLKRKNDDGKTGKQLFNADLKTLESASNRDTPGPRIVAHAISGDEAFILATTPSTYRALTGAGVSIPPAPPGDPERARRDSAIELLRMLRIAEEEARTWLGAFQSAQPTGGVQLLEEETALALFLLDEQSIQHLLTTLNTLISVAQAKAEDAFGNDFP